MYETLVTDLRATADTIVNYGHLQNEVDYVADVNDPNCPRCVIGAAVLSLGFRFKDKNLLPSELDTHAPKTEHVDQIDRFSDLAETFTHIVHDKHGTTVDTENSDRVCVYQWSDDNPTSEIVEALREKADDLETGRWALPSDTDNNIRDILL